MTATTAQAFSRVGGRPSLMKAPAMSADQPPRSETAAGRALSMTARTSTGLGAWRANLDPGPAQLRSRQRESSEAPSLDDRSTSRESQGRAGFFMVGRYCAAAGYGLWQSRWRPAPTNPANILLLGRRIL